MVTINVNKKFELSECDQQIAVAFRAVSLVCIGAQLVTSVLQDKIEWSQFCPYSNSCQPPASHLVCHYLRNGTQYGPKCTVLGPPVPRPYSQEHVDQVLALVNRWRGAVASGTQTVRDGELLKRGYGITRMRWDSELAGLAQLLANQCNHVIDHTCASTARFPEPVVFFFKAGSDNNNTEMNITAELHRGLYTGVGDFAKRVSAEDVYIAKNYTRLNAFTKIIQANATMIGCGSLQWLWHQESSVYRYGTYVLLTQCYVSARTPLHAPLYNTTPPAPGRGFTARCGCPWHHRETDHCLCEEYYPDTLSTPAAYYEPTYRNKELRGPVRMEESPELTTAPARPLSRAHQPACRRTLVLLPVIRLRSPRPRASSRAPLRRRFDDLNTISSAEAREGMVDLYNFSEKQSETVPRIFNKVRISQFNTAINNMYVFPKVLTRSPPTKDIILNNPFEIRNILDRDKKQMRDSAEKVLQRHYKYINVQNNDDGNHIRSFVPQYVAKENTDLKPLLEIVDQLGQQPQSKVPTTMPTYKDRDFLDVDKY